MRFFALLILGTNLSWSTISHAKVPAKDIEEVLMFICGEDMNIASHADNIVRESCKAEFVKDGKRYEVAYWADREERTLELRKGTVKITTVDEWLTFSIIELSQLDSPDTGRVLEQWMSLENRSGEIRSGMSGYAFEGGFKPPFIDRYCEGDVFADIPTDGEHLKPYWQNVVDEAAQATLDHFRSLRQQAALP